MCAFSRAKIVLSFFLGILLVFGAAFSAAAQSLDTVVAGLLETGAVNCEGLTNAGGVPVAGSGLANICSLAGGPGSSSGGTASTPQSAPGVVQERLESFRSEEKKAAQTGTVTELAPGLSFLLSTQYESLDRDITTFEDGYDSDIKRVTLGADYLFTESFMAGLALSYYQHNGDFSSGGDFENDAYNLTAFMSLVPHDQVFIQATLGYGQKNFDRRRQATLDIGASTVTGREQAGYDGTEYSGGVSAGYDYRMDNFSVGPRLGLNWLYSKFDGYTESGSSGLELIFEDTSEFSLQTRVGVESSVAVSTSFGVLVPQVNVDWVHELENDQRSENFSFVDDQNRVKFQYDDEKPDRDFFEVAAGVSAVLAHGWQAFAQYRTILGHDYLDSHVGTLGVRVEF